jgi:cytochrome b
MSKILVWDFPTRVFHWLLVAAFAGAYLTGESDELRDMHVVLGYFMLGLIAFRLVWGLIGSHYARFSSFWYSPAAVKDYVLSVFAMRPKHYLGHNPAGSWVIWLLLVLGVLTGATGYAVDVKVGGDFMEELHEGVANVMLAVIGLHIAGVVLSSLLHKENLAHAMVTGYKEDRQENPAKDAGETANQVPAANPQQSVQDPPPR